MENKREIILNDNGIYIFECLYCKNMIMVFDTEINCRIFRHGVYKDTYMQINPHASKTECDRLVTNGLIFGCGKPFRINESKTCIETCDY